MHIPLKLAVAIGGALLVAHSPVVHAATSAVVGYVTLNIDAATESSPKISTISLPLYAPITGNGAVTGRLTSVGASSLTNSSAGWTAGAFSQSSQPHLVKITSGPATGRIFRITENNATSLTVDNQGTSLNTLGIGVGSNGDTYEIFPADTIRTVFGSPADGVVGGTNADVADQVQILNAAGEWEVFYFNTPTGAWVAATNSANSDNRVIRPDEGIVYLRRGTTPLKIVLTGRVPDTTSRIVVRNSGASAIGSTWPVDTTLATSGIREISGWVSGPIATADQVQIYSPTKGWRSFYHDGTNWMRVGPAIISNDEPIPAGTAVVLARRGSSSDTTILTQNQPYNLND